MYAICILPVKVDDTFWRIKGKWVSEKALELELDAVGKVLYTLFSL
jgi:hypothetical protein